MRNSRLLPYETIVQATTGEPEAVNAVLQHYGRYIRFSALVDGQVDGVRIPPGVPVSYGGCSSVG